MKLAMIRANGCEAPAVLLADGRAVDLSAATKAGLFDVDISSSLIPFLEPGGIPQVAVKRLLDSAQAGGSFGERLVQAGALRTLQRGDFAPPVRPRLIVACAMAYKDHMEEMAAPLPTEPAAFVKSANTIIGPDDKIILPAIESELVDFECELTVVFGRRCFNVDEKDALSYIAGYTMVNDVGSRVGVTQWLKSLEHNDNMASLNLFHRFIRGKQFPTFCPIGPVITTPDEMGDIDNINVGTRLNGEVMQAANTSNLIFRIAYSIAYFSRWFEFMPGDILTTGSPAGVGFSRNPPVLLRHGDVVEVYSDGIGSLFNPVICQ